MDVPEEAYGRQALTMLRGEVRRCRLILDRMLAGKEGADMETPAIGERVREWVEDWRKAQDADVELHVSIQGADVTVRGGEDGWRDALWTLLDNARTAGEPLALCLLPGDSSHLYLQVDDCGPPVPPDSLARAGQPFSAVGGAGKGRDLAFLLHEPTPRPPVGISF